MSISIKAVGTKLEDVDLPPDERAVPIRVIDGFGYDLVRDMQELARAGKGVEAMSKGREVLAHLMPRATDKEIKSLNDAQIHFLIRYAGGETIEALISELGNAKGAETDPPAKAVPARTKTGSQRSTQRIKPST